MIVKIRRFGILQSGKICAAIYTGFSILMLPFFLLIGAADRKMTGPMLFMLLLYPVMGFIGGIIGAAFYNLAARWVGGIEMTLDGEILPSSLPEA